MPRKSKYPGLASVRVSQSTDDKIDAAAARLHIERADLLRSVLDEMPSDYVPAHFRAAVKSAEKVRR